jgi:hypothetical protein
MEEISASESAAPWEQLRPVLDEAMDELAPQDREAVLLRFFEGRPFAAVASVMRVSEDAARKRVDRALAKLEALLSRRGITSTGSALAVLLANQTSIAAPASVAASITAAALSATGASVGTAGVAGIFIMSTTKAVTGISAAVALIAIGSAVYQAKTSRDSDAARVAAVAERDDLRARFVAIEKRAGESDAQLAAARKELADTRTAPRPAAGEPQRAATAPSAGAAVDYVLEHPETHGAYVEQEVLRSKVRFDRFVKNAGLSPAQQEEFFKQIRDRTATELDFMLALRAQGFGVGNLPQDPQVRAGFQKLGAEQKEKFENGLRAALGDDGYKAFQHYGATLPERNVVDELGGRLYLSDTPLKAEQAEQLAQILQQNRYTGQPTASPTTTMNGTLLTRQVLISAIGQSTQQSGMSSLDWRAPVTDAAIARAESILTPAQLAALRQLQAQQVAQFQLAPPPPAASPGAAKLSGGK